MQDRDHTGQERLLHVEHVAEGRIVRERNRCRQDGRIPEPFKPLAELQQQGQEGLRRDVVEVQEILEVACFKGRRRIGEKVAVVDENRRLGGPCREQRLPSDGRLHRQGHSERAGRRERQERIQRSAGQFPDRQPAVGVGVHEGPRNPAVQCHAAAHHIGAHKPRRDADVQVGRRHRSRRDHFFGLDEKGIRGREPRRQVHAEGELRRALVGCADKSDSRVETQSGRGVHREPEARCLGSEVDRKLGAAAQGKVEIEDQLGLAHLRDQARELAAEHRHQLAHGRRRVVGEIGGDRLVEPGADPLRQIERLAERGVGEGQLLRERGGVVETVGPVHNGEETLQDGVAEERGNGNVLRQAEAALDLDAAEDPDQIVEAVDLTVGRPVDRDLQRSPGVAPATSAASVSPSMSSAPSMSARNMSVSSAGLNSSSVMRSS